MIFLQLAILSHCLADFVFQSDTIADLRRSNDFKKRLIANLVHSTNVVALLFFILIFGYKLITVCTFVLWIWIGHFCIDFIKGSLTSESLIGKIRTKNLKNEFINLNFRFIATWYELLLFIIDQTLHIFLIVIVWTSIDIEGGPLLDFIKSSPSLKLSLILSKFDRVFIVNLLNYLIVYILICFGGRYLIKILMTILNLSSSKATVVESKEEVSKSTPSFWDSFLNHLHLYKKTKNELPDKTVKIYKEVSYISRQTITSDYIGIFERFIIVTLVIHNAYPAITFIFTAKSLARFRELEDKAFVEYYLVGTLLSTGLGILGGVVVNLLV